MSGSFRWVFITFMVALTSVCTAAEQRDRPLGLSGIATGSSVQLTWEISVTADGSLAGSSLKVMRRRIDDPAILPRELLRATLEPSATTFSDDTSNVACGSDGCTDALRNLRYKVCFHASTNDLSPACSEEGEVRVDEAMQLSVSITKLARTPVTPGLNLRLGVYLRDTDGRYFGAARSCLDLAVRSDTGSPSLIAVSMEYCADDFSDLIFLDWRTPFTFPRDSVASHPMRFEACNGATCEDKRFDALSARPTRAPNFRVRPSRDPALVMLSWSQPSDARSTSVWRRRFGPDQSRPFTNVFNGPAPGRFFLDTVPEPGGRYEYRACAVNAGGSACTRSRLVNLPFPVPPAVTGLRARPNLTQLGRVEVRWDAVTPEARRHFLRLRPGSITNGFRGDRTSHAFTGLVPGVTYELTHTYRGERNRTSLPATVRFVPAVPEPVIPSLLLTNFDHGTLQYAWAPATGTVVEQTVTIERLVPQLGRYSAIAAPTGSSASGFDTGLPASTPQTYRLCARNVYKNRCGGPESATTVAADPQAPVADKISNDGAALTFSWSATPGVQGFIVQGWDGLEWRTVASDISATRREHAFVPPQDLVFLRVCAQLPEPEGATSCSAAASVR